MRTLGAEKLALLYIFMQYFCDKLIQTSYNKVLWL